MKKRVFIHMALVSMFTLVACGQAELDDTGMQNVDDLNMNPVEVELLVQDKAEVDEGVALTAVVTQGDEQVDDASDIIFEVWEKNNKEESFMIDAELPGEDGKYTVVHQFSNDSVYFVQLHVTARGMHVMPIAEIVVGDAVQEEEEGNHHDNDHSHDDHHGEHHRSLKVDWLTDDVVTSEEIVHLSVYVEKNEEAWTEGDVQFEIWKHGDEKHEWVDATEGEEAVYETSIRLEEAGSYHVIVHLEAENIHEHIEYDLIVK